MRVLTSIYLSNRFYGLFILNIILFISGYFLPILFTTAKYFFLMLVGAIIAEIILLFYKRELILCKRHLPVRLSNGDENEVKLYIINRYFYKSSIQVIDEIPFQFQIRDFNIEVSLKPYEEKVFSYSLKPTKRGEYEFGKINIYAAGVMGLLKRRYMLGFPVMVPVYPSFLQMNKYQLHAFSNTLQEAGIKKIRRLGHYTEFDQIKEYIKGDDFRTINWKATARKNNLMVNQYQDERAQPVYSIIDKGRLMERAFDGMTYLDYAINSSLVISNIALQKYDKVGLISFNTTIDSYLTAERKNNTLIKILEALYNQKTEFLESNFELLYVTLKNKIKRRSLIILYTNFSSLFSLKRSLNYLRHIARYHVLLVVIFENSEIKKLAEQQPESIEDVYITTIAEKYTFEEKAIVKELNRHGIYSVLTHPINLTVNLINKYLEMKSLGLI